MLPSSAAALVPVMPPSFNLLFLLSSPGIARAATDDHPRAHVTADGLVVPVAVKLASAWRPPRERAAKHGLETEP